MRNRYILLADLSLIAIAAFGAFALRFDLLFPQQRPEFLPFLLAALAVKPVVFYAFGMYGRYWRYASAQDLVAVTLAVSVSSMAMALFVLVGTAANLVSSFSRQVIFIDWLLTLTLVGGVRMSLRVIGDARRRAQKGTAGTPPKRVLVAGAGEAGALVVREMQRNPQLGMVPVGFLDDAPGKLGTRIQGVRVLGPLSAMPGLLSPHGVDEVIVAMPAASGIVVRSVVEKCRVARVSARAVPGVFELLDGHVSISRLRRVEITDLLRRSQVAASQESAAYVAGRTVLVTGAGGSIGSELCRQLMYGRPEHLVLLGHGENSIFETESRLREQFPEARLTAMIADVRDEDRLNRVFERVRPSLVFHAAAHKHVPLMEENPEEAISNNVFGTLNVVNAALKSGGQRLVLISTDKAVAPVSIMGASKRLAELVVRESARRHGRAFVVVRFGNVLGSRGSVVPLFKRQIEVGGPVKVTHPDMKRFFMTIPEAVHLVLEAGGMGEGGELYVLNMGQPVRIVDLAQDLIRLSGLEPGDIRIDFTGMRPGEKLEEDLWERDAFLEPTPNPDILRIIEPDVRPEQDPNQIIRNLARAIAAGERQRIYLALTECIPTYAPHSCSIISASDKQTAP